MITVHTAADADACEGAFFFGAHRAQKALMWWAASWAHVAGGGAMAARE